MRPGRAREWSPTIWHELENGAYVADLALWRELAAAAGGPVLDLGAGAGRVALDLAAGGHEVVALDSDPELLAVIEQRERAVTTVCADARDFTLRRRFALVLAPMQLVQILDGGTAARAAMLRCVRDHLSRGARFAAALADAHSAIPAPEEPQPPLPDVLEREGWVFSSRPLAVREERGGRVVIERLREAVAPSGEIREDTVRIALESVSPAALETEALAAGLAPDGRRTIPETTDHIGSQVVLCRR